MTRRRRRVLHVTSSLGGGGAERVLLTVLAGLTELSHALVLPAGAPAALLPLVPASVPIRIVRGERDLADVVRTTRADVVHTWLDGSLVHAAPVAARLGVPLVHRLCNVSSEVEAHEPAGAAHHAMMSSALRSATRVVALSATAADDAVRFYGIGRPEVIVNGLPLAGTRTGGAPPVSKRPGQFVILAVGRFTPQKGHGCLIEAFAQVATRYPYAEVWLAGVGDLDATLHAQAARLGVAERVRFLGFQEDVAALHTAADLFAFPSVFEGFGNALVEALLAGLPVVASDLPVIRHDVLGDRSAARLVAPGDAGALAAALDRLIPDAAARAALGAAGREAAAPFHVIHMLEAYRRLYAGVAGTTRVAA